MLSTDTTFDKLSIQSGMRNLLGETQGQAVLAMPLCHHSQHSVPYVEFPCSCTVELKMSPFSDLFHGVRIQRKHHCCRE